jgi:hypothetical protein
MSRAEARFARALAAIDAANAQDPNTLEVRGKTRPKELAHAELASEWVRILAPDASEALQLAARAHHVRRWEIPRTTEPPGRAGYHRWRRKLQEHHAQVTREILAAEGFAPDTVERVLALIRKQGLGRDPELQVLEDALCLVFLETQFEALAARLDPEKRVDVTRKTLRKMSPTAIEHARGLSLSDAARAILERASAD